MQPLCTPANTRLRSDGNYDRIVSGKGATVEALIGCSGRKDLIQKHRLLALFDNQGRRAGNEQALPLLEMFYEHERRQPFL